MFKQTLLDHFVNAGLNPDNMDKGHIDAYFAAVTDTDGVYLPDPSVTPVDRAADTLGRVAAENPDLPVAMTRFEQPDGVYLAASFLWEDLVRVDLLFPFSPSFDGTVWVTASSASEFIHGFLYGSDQAESVTAVEATQPDWAAHGFVLLVGLPPTGVDVVDETTSFDETVPNPGVVQRAAGSVFGHHMLHRNALSGDELNALLLLLGATIDGKTVSMATLLAVGAMNPFASEEPVVLRSTTAGTVLLGSKAVVGPLLRLVPTQS